MEQLNVMELGILDWIQSHMQCTFLDRFFPWITRLGDAGIFWILLAVFLLLFKKTRKTGLMMGLAMVFGVLIGNLALKPLVARIRPYDVATGITLLIEQPHDFSFPSGHTLASFEAAIVLLIRDRRMGIPAVILALLIGFSRMYLYVHYFTDVLAGAVMGTLFAILAVYIVEFLYRKHAKSTELPQSPVTL